MKCASVAHGNSPPLWMGPGDVIEVEIDRVGHLRSTVIDELIVED